MDESDNDSEANQFNRIFIYISQGMDYVFGTQTMSFVAFIKCDIQIILLWKGFIYEYINFYSFSSADYFNYIKRDFCECRDCCFINE